MASVIKSFNFQPSESLTKHYMTIGRELLSLEEESDLQAEGVFAQITFREGVVFVSIEVLEAYLEDLLNLRVAERRLYIKRERLTLLNRFLGALLLFAVGGVLVARPVQSVLTVHLSWVYPLLLLAALLFGFLLAHNTILRRLTFARLVSQEIGRRRGRDLDRGSTHIPSWVGLVNRKKRSPVHGMARVANLL